ncbi:hypothetical protein QNI19_36295 [Cytophagaceae bacterium DM2B3-1]|uniref:Uncharacterized protein n=1 Tax=Xanthocytophaga flava TaxID=3048013 RepID=A0ABT7CXF1_9BACT|nr:hypothetical protein [Xanthocytophaga flavus]MDJ1466761.1 hypothetical protein [Xanthocytophaga flavus]MDJ1498453.1 hypothetical protein [Xanthocytophaga flavus]
MTYKLEKYIWTDKDYEQMGWHDSTLYKIRVTQDLELDIDYILKWNPPDLDGLSFTFWVAPATLVFKNITILYLELDVALSDHIEIEDIERIETSDGIEWTIMTRQGELTFLSVGYEQFIRQEPFFEFGQSISFTARGGLSLERTTNQINPWRTRNDVLAARQQDIDYYEHVKRRHLKRTEKEQLEIEREANTIDLKQYLIKKRELNVILAQYDLYLKDTRFERW